MRKEKSQLYRINAKKYQQIGFQIRVKDIKRGVCRNGGKTSTLHQKGKMERQGKNVSIERNVSQCVKK